MQSRAKPRAVDVEASLESFQRIVGGYVEAVKLSAGVHMYINEEGKRLGLPRNLSLPGLGIICGSVCAFATSKNGDEISLTTEQTIAVMEWLKIWRVNT